MAKITRMFELIQVLRAADKPVLARDIAEQLEVSKRTIYRDIAALQAMRTPIYGEPGVGYVMRKGYDLPAVNFDVDEAEAVKIGLSLVARTGDEALWNAAKRAARKLSGAMLDDDQLIASSWSAVVPTVADTGLIRGAIRDEVKLAIRYEDVNGRTSERVLWPLVMIYYVDSSVLVSWCETRDDFRHFRLDRMQSCDVLSVDFKGQGAALRRRWEDLHKDETVSTR